MTSALLLYDEHGNRVDQTIPKDLLKEILTIFDGKPRAIRRTTGGLSLCEPFQIVLYDRTILDPNTQWRPEREATPLVRIRVRFHELVRDEHGNVAGNETVLKTKTVHFGELREAFEITGDPKQPVIADFGLGVVPVSVFHIEDRPGHEPIAYFTELGLLEGIATSAGGSLSLVATYSAPLSVLRLPYRDGDLELANRNMTLHQKRELRLLPATLRHQTRIPLPTGKSVIYLKSCLRAMLNPSERKELEPLILEVKKEDELMPFGVLEPHS